MNDSQIRSKLVSITSLSAEYCSLLENARSMEKEDFIAEILGYLPRLYMEFFGFDLKEEAVSADFNVFPQYVDEDFYESVRRNVESLLGPDDSFLETFEEDMKYSDTPIASSISECLADIFQPLYNFICVVKESEGDQAAAAYQDCRDNFVAYWAQTLCNVMRALNNVYFNSNTGL